MSWIIAGSQPSTGLLAMGVRFASTPRKIRRTRITRLKPCACSSPRVHKFNININTGDGGSVLDYCGLATLNGLARNGRSLRYTPRKIRRTRITRLKPCACSTPYVHKFNININTGDGGSRTRVQNDNKRESTSLESFYLNAKSERCL